MEYGNKVTIVCRDIYGDHSVHSPHYLVTEYETD